MIHVFIGTKAQYIKTAPLLRLMDARGVAYRLIDSGQHARISIGMRRELRVREPDLVLGGSADVSSIPAALAWSARLAAKLWSGRRLRRDIFAGEGGVCVVHGDTPSTLLATLMARRAGLTVAHLEAGLRSHHLLHPFPEEIIRIITMRLAGILFAPDQTAEQNLASLRVRGAVVPLPANTSLEAVRDALGAPPAPGTGPAIVTMHRVENLHSRARVAGFVRLAVRLAKEYRVRFVMHEPTINALAKHRDDLEAAGVETTELAAYPTFVRMIAEAPLVVTDGGSIQEECAVLGVPTLLWRARTERPDGLGENVVLSGYDARAVERFLDDPGSLRRPPRGWDAAPSEVILDALLAAIS
ncbi:MAG TPA: UDP-N-acetylglucosamine 2-epimerase [Actinomycetota bacterium]